MRQLHSRHQAGGSGLHIALHAGDLAGEGQARFGDDLVIVVEQLGRVDVSVAVHDAVADELSILAGRGSSEKTRFCSGQRQVGLKAHQVVDAAGRRCPCRSCTTA